VTDRSWDPPKIDGGDKPGAPGGLPKWYARKIGPMPVWVWLVGAFFLIGAIGNLTEGEADEPGAETGSPADVDVDAEATPDDAPESVSDDESTSEPSTDDAESPEVAIDDVDEPEDASSSVTAQGTEDAGDTAASSSSSTAKVAEAGDEESGTASTDSGSSNWEPAEVTEGEAAVGDELLSTLVIAPEPNRTGYSRTSWSHWRDINSSGCTAREDVLIAQVALGAEVDPTDDCKIVTGTWFSAWDSVTHTGSPSDLDMDHIVALAEAHDSGGSNWDAATKRMFANDPANLVAVTASSNRSKSDQDVGSWRPTQNVWCSTATTVIAVKSAYGLTVDRTEHDALVEMLSTCGSSGQLSLGVAPSSSQTVSTVAPSTSAPPAPVTTTTQAPAVAAPTTTAPATTVPATTAPPTTAPAPETTAAPSPPANPGNSKNCSDFSSYAEAKAWFDTYFPYYGDVAGLDSDSDGEPCESLSGGPSA